MTAAEFALLKKSDPDCIFSALRYNATRASGLKAPFYDVMTKERVEDAAAKMSPGERARLRIHLAPAIAAVEGWFERMATRPHFEVVP